MAPPATLRESFKTQLYLYALAHHPQKSFMTTELSEKKKPEELESTGLLVLVWTGNTSKIKFYETITLR